MSWEACAPSTEEKLADVADGSAALPELLRLFDREQIALKSISLSEPTLDDVFLRYTGRSLRDTGTTSEVAA